MSRSLRALGRLAGIAVAAFGARELVQTISAYQSLQNTIRTVVDTDEQLVATQSRLADISRTTRTDLQATTQLYQRATIAAGELGASQDELFRLVEITGKALAVQGGAASEASGALRQLSQSFSSGIVRAEEFNSILEGAFPIAQAAARGLDAAGGSVGKLRNLVVAGEVSSREFFEAILKGGEGIEAQFAKTQVTIAQAGTVLKNTLLTSIGRLNEATGAGAGLANIIIAVADTIETLTDALVGQLDPLDELSHGMQQAAVVAIALGATFQSLFDLLGVGKAIFVDFGESLGAIAAAAVQAAKGNFSEAAAILREPAFEDAQAAFTDFFETFDANVEDASARISAVLLPAFRSIREEVEAASDTEVKPLVPEIDPKVLERQAEFLEALRRQRAELAIQTGLLDEAEAALLRYNVAVDAAALGDARFVEQALELADAINLQAEALEAAQNRAADADLVTALEQELELIGLGNRERAIEIELRKLSAEATAAQKESVAELAGAIFDQQEALKNETDFLKTISEQAARNIQDTFADFLFDPFDEGLEGLVSNFADALKRMAAEALAAEIFGKLFSGAGASGGGLGDLLSGFLGGRQFGGGMGPGDSAIVGERGPELFQAPTSGTIVPASSANFAPNISVPVQVINVTDPNEIPAAMQGQRGQEVILNAIRANPDAVREVIQ